MIAIIDNHRIVAFLLLYCNHKDTLDAYLCNVYVLMEYRGRGLTKKLLSKAIEVCKKNGFKSVSLDVNCDNVIAIHIYEKYGFKRVHGERAQDEQIKMRYYFDSKRPKLF